jgi:hypothetical protein
MGDDIVAGYTRSALQLACYVRIEWKGTEAVPFYIEYSVVAVALR